MEMNGVISATWSDSRATRSCNASLHDMTMVQLEHIAYACVQVSVLVYLTILSHMESDDEQPSQLARRPKRQTRQK